MKKHFAFYNEFDGHAAAWLRELIKMKLIMDGEVAERSICDINISDFRGFTRVHWFAGLGGWDFALQRAGWPEEKPVWTASLPCQPWSSAGAGKAHGDDRHLWPIFYQFVLACRPTHLIGEQVCSAAVVGPVDKTKVVRRMQHRKTLRRIFQELERGASEELQGVRVPGCSNLQTGKLGKEFRSFQRLEDGEAGSRIDERSQTSGEDEGAPVRSGPKRHSEQDRQGDLRGNGDSVQPNEPKILGRTILGPNNPAGWLHPDECPGCPLCGECDGEQLGYRQDLQSYLGIAEDDDGEVQRSHDEDSAAIQGAQPSPWHSGICADLERALYTVGSLDSPAACVGEDCEIGVLRGDTFAVERGVLGPPHIRQRLYWFAVRTDGVAEPQGEQPHRGGPARGGRGEPSDGGGLVHAVREGRERQPLRLLGTSGERNGSDCGLADADGRDTGAEREQRSREHGCLAQDGGTRERVAHATGGGLRIDGSPSRGAGHADERSPVDWTDFHLIPCLDGKARRVKSGIQPLTHALPRGVVPSGDPGSPEYANATGEARTMRLRGYGNSIVVDLAAEFISTCMEVIDG